MSLKASIGAFRVSSAFFLSTLVGFFSTLLATGAVVCLCHDGHISIESRCNPVQCCPEDGTTASTTPSADTRTDSGHACIDLALNDAVVRARAARSDEAVTVNQPELPGVEPLTTLQAPTPQIVSVLPPVQPTAPVQPALLRTVILTI